MRRIVVLRALYLGDMLCAVPALRALRHAAPQAQIVLAGLPWAKQFAARFSNYVDAFIDFPGFPGLPEQAAQAQDAVAFLSRLHERKFDLALQMHGNGRYANVAIGLMGAADSAGFYAPGSYCPDPATFLPYPTNEHEIWRNLRLVEHLGAPLVGDELEFSLRTEDYQRLESCAGTEILADNPYICLHVGAKLRSRRWPAERFAEVASALGHEGYHVVLTGTAGERSLVDRVAASLTVPHLNLCGTTDLGALGALVHHARLLISNDTGVAHVAAALGTPSVIVVLGSDPQRWAPLDQDRHRVVMQPIICRPCEYDGCPIGFPCAMHITALDVLAAAHEQLARWHVESREVSTALATPSAFQAQPCLTLTTD